MHGEHRGGSTRARGVQREPSWSHQAHHGHTGHTAPSSLGWDRAARQIYMHIYVYTCKHTRMKSSGKASLLHSAIMSNTCNQHSQPLKRAGHRGKQGATEGSRGPQRTAGGHQRAAVHTMQHQSGPPTPHAHLHCA